MLIEPNCLLGRTAPRPFSSLRRGGSSNNVIRAIIDPLDIRPDSKGNRFRLSQVNLLKALISGALKHKSKCALLDVGGTYNFWQVWESEIDWTHTEVTCVNLNPHHANKGKEQSRVRMIHGNACNLSEIGDHEYDIVFSNSVIEHVGSWQNMSDMAREVRRVARRYLVQTPNFWFPIEPHARTPFLHWLPEPIAYRVVMSRKCGFWAKQDTVSGAVKTVQSAKLLDVRQMQALFDDATILRERFCGITKALIAIKGL